MPTRVASGIVTTALHVPSVRVPEARDKFATIFTVPIVATTVETSDPYETALVEIVTVCPTMTTDEEY